MKLRIFLSLPCIGDVEIHTDSGHGSYDKLLINGQNLTEDGDAVEMVREAIDHKTWIFALYSAQYENHGVYRQNEAS